MVMASFTFLWRFYSLDLSIMFFALAWKPSVMTIHCQCPEITLFLPDYNFNPVENCTLSSLRSWDGFCCHWAPLYPWTNWCPTISWNFSLRHCSVSICILVILWRINFPWVVPAHGTSCVGIEIKCILVTPFKITLGKWTQIQS